MTPLLLSNTSKTCFFGLPAPKIGGRGPTERWGVGGWGAPCCFPEARECHIYIYGILTDRGTTNRGFRARSARVERSEALRAPVTLAQLVYPCITPFTLALRGPVAYGGPVLYGGHGRVVYR